jgi:D-alanine-D-alanine ligase-like ATP-grasp enzyme
MESINKIAVLFGGSSGEREVSLESGKRVYDAIITLGYDCDKFDINDIKDINVLRNFRFYFHSTAWRRGRKRSFTKTT